MVFSARLIPFTIFIYCKGLCDTAILEILHQHWIILEYCVTLTIVFYQKWKLTRTICYIYDPPFLWDIHCLKIGPEQLGRVSKANSSLTLKGGVRTLIRCQTDHVCSPHFISAHHCLLGAHNMLPIATIRPQLFLLPLTAFYCKE